MYVPSAFAEERLDVLHEFIVTHDFATLITRSDGEMAASHLPMLLLPARGRFGTLQVHLARQNEQGRALAAGESALAIFQGPHAYVSPRYAQPVSVPTWNYVVVHAQGDGRGGVARAFACAGEEKYEPREEGWDATELPGDVFEKLQQQIIGFEIEITSLQGKWKLGQNRTSADRQGAIDGLRQTGDAEANALAEWMAAALRA